MNIGIIAKRGSMIALVLALFAVSACGWIGYGSPFREVVFSGGGQNARYDRAFFISKCAKSACFFDPAHAKVMHFSMGDGVMGYPGDIDGEGKNPVALARRLGSKFIPEPRYEIAALRWCTSKEIFQEFRYHGRHYIVPLTNDPLATARCVKRQIPRPFSVAIGDPKGGNLNSAVFRSLAR